MRTLKRWDTALDAKALEVFESVHDIEGWFVLEFPEPVYPKVGNAYGYYEANGEGVLCPVLITPYLRHAVRVAERYGKHNIIRIGLIDGVFWAEDFSVNALFHCPDFVEGCLIVKTPSGLEAFTYTPEVISLSEGKRLVEAGTL